MKDLPSFITDAKYGYMKYIFRLHLICIGIVSKLDIESSSRSIKSFVSSSESEIVPLGPPRRSLCFKVESTVLGDPGGSCYQ